MLAECSPVCSPVCSLGDRNPTECDLGYVYIHVVHVYIIIESAVSNVGIVRTRNIGQYKKNSQNLKNGKLISLYNNVPFIFECFHDEQHTQWRQKALRKYRTRKSPDGQNVFLLSSSDRLVQKF